MRSALPACALLALSLGCLGRSNLSTGTPPGTRDALGPEAALVRRKSAEHIVSSLKSQLGLTDSDVFGGSYRDPPLELYPTRSSDAIPLISAEAEGNYFALGGPSWLKSRKATAEASTVFAQQLVAMSQAWCRLAVNKPANPVLTEASLSDSSSTPQGRERIVRNIARLHLTMLGEPASDADLADLLELFQTFEPSGAEAAWTAVCAGLVRHPLWITF